MLALLMWREDSGDGLQGMAAVGLVVRNRVVAGWSGGDWLAVMDGHNQFSSISVLGDPGTVRYPDSRDPRFLNVLIKATNIYEGTEPDTTGGALYYANLVTMNSQWFKTAILGNPEQHRRIGTVGAQTFFA